VLRATTEAVSMRTQLQGRKLYDVTVSGVTATIAGPDDIAAMYRKMREAYPASLSVIIRSLDDLDYADDLPADTGRRTLRGRTR
jgi:hypothetical protein